MQYTSPTTRKGTKSGDYPNRLQERDARADFASVTMILRGRRVSVPRPGTGEYSRNAGELLSGNSFLSCRGEWAEQEEATLQERGGPNRITNVCGDPVRPHLRAGSLKQEATFESAGQFTFTEQCEPADPEARAEPLKASSGTPQETSERPYGSPCRQ